MSVTRGEWARWEDLGAQKARAYGEKGREDRPHFGNGRDAELGMEAWLSGFDSAQGAKR